MIYTCIAKLIVLYMHIFLNYISKTLRSESVPLLARNRGDEGIPGQLEKGAGSKISGSESTSAKTSELGRPTPLQRPSGASLASPRGSPRGTLKMQVVEALGCQKIRNDNKYEIGNNYENHENSQKLVFRKHQVLQNHKTRKCELLLLWHR